MREVFLAWLFLIEGFKKYGGVCKAALISVSFHTSTYHCVLFSIIWSVLFGSCNVPFILHRARCWVTSLASHVRLLRSFKIPKNLKAVG